MKKSILFREKLKSTPICSDDLFSIFVKDVRNVEELLRVVLDNECLIVKSVKSQYFIENLNNKQIYLDALCIDEKGNYFDIEVQLSNKNDNNIKRARYYGSALTINSLEKGKSYKELKNVSIIFLNNFDIFHKEKQIYHVKPTILETNEIVYNGYEEIYVDISKKYNNKLGKYMNIFTSTNNIKDFDFPRISEFNQIKNGNRKDVSMTELQELFIQMLEEDGYIDKIKQEGRNEGKFEGKNEGKLEGELNTIVSLFKQNIISKEIACQQLKLTDEQFEKILLTH